MLLVILRIMLLALATLFFAILAILVYPITPRAIWVHVLKFEAKCLVFLLGIEIRVEGDVRPYIERNALVIANHISWIDIPILYTQHSVEFIAKQEIRRWPIVGSLVKSGNTIFVDRSRRHSVTDTIMVVGERLRSGGTVCLFPEGTTGSGIKLLPFKSALFEAAILNNSMIIPLVISYYTRDGLRTSAVSYAKKITFWQCLVNSLRLNGIVVKITALNPVKAIDYKDRDILVKYLYQQMSAEFDNSREL